MLKIEYMQICVCVSDEYFLGCQYLTEKLTLGKQSSLLGGKTVGDVPFGIPVNIQITGEFLSLDSWCLCVKDFSRFTQPL